MVTGRILRKEITIENIIGSIDLGNDVDIQKAQKKLSQLKAKFDKLELKKEEEITNEQGKSMFYGEFYPSEHPALLLKPKNNPADIFIANSGKVTLMGVTSEEELENTAKNLVSLLKEGQININPSPVQVQNIVASTSTDREINLERLGTKGGYNFIYDPEKLPSLAYRMEEPHVVSLLFESGKIVCMGAKEEKDIVKAFEKVDEKIREHQAYLPK